MAGKIYVTGDTHGRLHKFNMTKFPKQKNLDKDDFMIICGDFGVVWGANEEMQENRGENWWLDWLEQLPFTVLFVDGNHENFDRLYNYAVEEWHGGKVHKIRPSVIHLMRGQVFEIAGKKLFTFGGAASHDISDGILEPDDPRIREKIEELNKQRALFRINHVSWWKEELPSEEELEEGRINLAKHGNKVDYIISHCCPGQIQQLVDNDINERNVLTAYFDSIRLSTEYDKWYFGHYHQDKTITNKEVLLYHRIIELGEEIDEMTPVLGQPRYKLYHPVKFIAFAGADTGSQEKIGVVAITDPYGTFSDSSEPSYDIYAIHEGDICLFKHYAETEVTALTQEEIKENAELISYISTHWCKKEVKKE